MNVRKYCAARFTIAASVCLLVMTAYWPVRHAEFAWDDLTAFVENDWLVVGDQWRHYVMRDFHNWTNYFRPVGVGLFTLQARAFESEPGPMHLVSLAIHLLNTSLVGAIVASILRLLARERAEHLAWIAASMLLYGLHPALTESVAWISSQFELLLVFFCLLTAWAAIAMPAGWPRTLLIGVGFFLSACSKETAMVLPALVLLVDWAVLRRRAGSTPASVSRVTFIRRNAGPAAAMLAAGGAYLWFRHIGLGHLLVPTPVYGGDLSPLGDVQRVTYTWWSYLKLLVLPVRELGAVYSFDRSLFERPQPALLGLAVVSSALVGWSIYLVIRHATPAACMVLAIVLALIPTLNLLPAGYAISLYHDRYVALALAVFCIMLPLIGRPTRTGLRRPAIGALGAASALAWIAMSLFTIRGTLPTWQDDEALWRSTIVRNPANEVVQYNLVAALLRSNKIREAHAHAENFRAIGSECVRCEIEIASFQIDRGDYGRAAVLVQGVAASHRVTIDPVIRARYFFVAGHLAFEQNDPHKAIHLLRSGLGLIPDDLAARVLLVESLAVVGSLNEASSEGQRILESSDDRTREVLEHWFLDLHRRIAQPANMDIES